MTTSGEPNLHDFLYRPDKAGQTFQGMLVRDEDRLVATLTQGSAANVIASTEAFSFLFDGAEIRRLARLLQPHFTQIRIVSYLRRQDQLAVSHHQQGARPARGPAAALYGFSPTALPPPNASQTRYLDYDTRLGLWADAFGPDAMRLRVFDRALLRGGDVVLDFCAEVGLNPQGLVLARDLNPSIGALRTKLGHMLNEAISSPLIRAQVLNDLPEGGKLLPSKAEAAAFLAPYVAGNRRLNARFGISADPHVFSPDFSGYPVEKTDSWTDETASLALRACLLVIEKLSCQQSDLSVADLREAAMALQHSQPETALRLLRHAVAVRPESAKLNAALRALTEAAPVQPVAAKVARKAARLARKAGQTN